VSLRDLANPKKKRERFTRTLTLKQVRAMKKRGYDAERELVQMMREQGFNAVRVPVSAPSTEPLPDVFAVKGNNVIAFEVKSQVKYAYYKSDQIRKLNAFLDIHKIYPKGMQYLPGSSSTRVGASRSQPDSEIILSGMVMDFHSKSLSQKSVDCAVVYVQRYTMRSH